MSWLARSITNTLLLDENHTHNQNDVVFDESLKLQTLPDSTNRTPDFEDRELGHDLVNRFDNVELGIDGKEEEDEDEDDFDDGVNEGRGVKEDLSELTETLTRQFWGVASFLAPPPPPPPPLPPSLTIERDLPPPPPPVMIRSFEEEVGEDGREEDEDSRWNSDRYNVGDREDEDARSSDRCNVGDGEDEDLRRSSDRLNVGDREDEDLRSSDRLNVGDEEEEDSVSYCNSDCSNVGDQDEVGDAIGVTEEALTFAQNIGHHPETWLDFPLEEEEEEGFEDFHISDSQYKHALAIQRLVPTLAALKIELCPVHMSEGYFWMVYFVLLHSRLNKTDADQLSSSELVQARSMWREELQKRAKLHTDWFDRSTFHLQDNTLSPTLSPREDFDHELLDDSDSRHLSFNTCIAGSRLYHEQTYNETEKQIVECDTAKSADTPSGHSERDYVTFQSSQILQDHDDEDDEDDWLQETEELDGYPTTGIMVNEEDVSFSDLEEDSDWTLPVKSK